MPSHARPSKVSSCRPGGSVHPERGRIHRPVGEQQVRPAHPHDPWPLHLRSTVESRSRSALRGLQLARVGEGRAAARGPGRGHRLAVDADRVVDAAHHEVAGDRPPQGRPDRGHLVEDLVRPRRPGRARGARRAHALGDVAGGLAGRPAAQVLVLADDDLVERAGGDRPVLALVLVAAVAGDADDADRPAGPRRRRRADARPGRPWSGARPSSARRSRPAGACRRRCGSSR